jgi:hypothetical protein
MNTQQTTDLIAWLKNQEETLPESLANILIEDCLEELKNSEETSKKLGLLCDDRFNGICIYEEGSRTFRYWLFQDYSNKDKVYIIQTLLSQIDGKAVLGFLEVKLDQDTIDDYLSERNYPRFNLISYNLVDILSLLFSWFLSHGKTFEEAWEIITKIYLVQRYV